MKQAIQGKAFDRHFLGLQSMIETQDELSDSIFSKPWFQRSSHFGLSTSNVSPGTNYHGGFAPAIPQGYGINYAIDEGQLRFTISCRRGDSDSGKAKLAKFKAALERSLRDMRLMFPKAPKV